MSVVDNVPDRVRHYLLDWKDRNLEEYKKHYGERSLRELTKFEIVELFVFAYHEDVHFINNNL